MCCAASRKRKVKIQIISDLHLEFQEPPLIENVGADVLIMGGDIFLAEYFYRNPRVATDVHSNVRDLSDVINDVGYSNDVRKWREFLQHVNDNWSNVFYLAGNHEHYKGRWNRTVDILREEVSYYPNIHFMDQDKVVIDDIQFLGASLWTDLNKDDPITRLSAKGMMNDYRAIKIIKDGAFQYLHPEITLAKHRSDLEWFRTQLQLDSRKAVIMTHHAPSRQSIHANFKDQHIMNGAFFSDLDELMLDNEHLVLWTHGHVHNCFDYQIGNTRVICNPHGYPSENSYFNPNVVVEIA